ncbi:phage tail protein [Caballeronia zhejiangensis]|uniref:phage tail protein n=1 Tax=Caballeronia zhejiangensis TaxID=871203 RepID=UPI001EF3D9C0|nr:phage tail protein [Caballeronia zhejiangensis]MCG7403008.1 phage tail protein [Caballeronia zhejiangensis]
MPIPVTVLPLTDIMRARVLAIPSDPQLIATTVKASGLVFKWCVSEASYDLEPKIIKAQFGDGYAQRRPAGINTQACIWSLSMKNIDAATAGEVQTFLSDRNGVEVFNWTPPRQIVDPPVVQDMICPSWNLAYGQMIADGSLLYNLQFRFEQVFL